MAAPVISSVLSVFTCKVPFLSCLICFNSHRTRNRSKLVCSLQSPRELFQCQSQAPSPTPGLGVGQGIGIFKAPIENPVQTSSGSAALDFVLPFLSQSGPPTAATTATMPPVESPQGFMCPMCGGDSKRAWLPLQPQGRKQFLLGLERGELEVPWCWRVLWSSGVPFPLGLFRPTACPILVLTSFLILLMVSVSNTLRTGSGRRKTGS